MTNGEYREFTELKNEAQELANAYDKKHSWKNHNALYQFEAKKMHAVFDTMNTEDYREVYGIVHDCLRRNAGSRKVASF